MKIKLSNGKELEPLMVTGGQQYVQGQSRDTLSFVFDGGTDMAELDQAFRAENCGDIILTDDQGGEYLHHGYAIRHELKKAIHEENFERAAEIRDELRAMEGKDENKAS